MEPSLDNSVNSPQPEHEPSRSASKSSTTGCLPKKLGKDSEQSQHRMCRRLSKASTASRSMSEKCEKAFGRQYSRSHSRKSTSQKIMAEDVADLVTARLAIALHETLVKYHADLKAKLSLTVSERISEAINANFKACQFDVKDSTMDFSGEYSPHGCSKFSGERSPNSWAKYATHGSADEPCSARSLGRSTRDSAEEPCSGRKTNWSSDSKSLSSPGVAPRKRNRNNSRNIKSLKTSIANGFLAEESKARQGPLGAELQTTRSSFGRQTTPPFGRQTTPQDEIEAASPLIGSLCEPRFSFPTNRAESMVKSRVSFRCRRRCGDIETGHSHQQVFSAVAPDHKSKVTSVAPHDSPPNSDLTDVQIDRALAGEEQINASTLLSMCQSQHRAPETLPPLLSAALECQNEHRIKFESRARHDSDSETSDSDFSPQHEEVDQRVNTNSSLCTFHDSAVRMSSRKLSRVRANELTDELRLSDEFESNNVSPQDDFDPVESLPPDGEDNFKKKHTLEVGSRPPLVLCICGIFPWETYLKPQGALCRRLSICYRRTVFAVSFITLSCLVAQIVSMRLHGHFLGQTCDVHHQACWQHASLSDLLLATGAVVALLVLGTKALCDCDRLLHFYTSRENLLQVWRSLVRRDFAMMFALWICAFVLRIYTSGLILALAENRRCSHIIIPLTSFAVASFILTGLSCAVLYVCRALTVMVDTFACRVVDHSDVLGITYEWNVLQAVMQKTASCVEYCFCALHAAAWLAVLVSVADVLLTQKIDTRDTLSDLPSLIPGVLVTFGIVRMVFCAATVSDKCSQCAPLINSLSFGDGTEEKRKSVVEYIIYSNAGFYVFDVRLTTAIALKFTYVWLVVVFGLTTKVLST